MPTSRPPSAPFCDARQETQSHDEIAPPNCKACIASLLSWMPLLLTATLRCVQGCGRAESSTGRVEARAK
eukprot:1402884-Pleurochrysis_carterae.AAC.1